MQVLQIVLSLQIQSGLRYNGNNMVSL